MASHDEEYGAQKGHRHTPLNDNVAYMLEQAKYKMELESFAWSRNDAWVDYQDTAHTRQAVVDSGRTSVDIDITRDEVEEETTSVDMDQRGVESEVFDTPVQHHVDREETPKQVPDIPLPPLPPSPLASPSLAARVPLPSPSTDTLASIPIEGLPIRHLLDGKGSAPRPIPTSPKRPLIKRDKSDLTLPTGLPGSGLSVSDLISIPSPGLNSPSRIVRRHKALPSIDTIPISRLSVDIGGTIANLDDDWEQLDIAEGIESLPNVAPGSSFFNRVLKRRPSTLHGSGLRRQTKHSDASERSPTKKTPMPWTGNTKKALEKIKAFPILRKTTSPPTSFRPAEPVSPERPEAVRRHTESGWFDKRPRLKKSVTESKLNRHETRSVSAKGTSEKSREEKERGMMGMSRSVSGIPRQGKIQPEFMTKSHSTTGMEVDPPKLELTSTPPIVWNLDARAN